MAEPMDVGRDILAFNHLDELEEVLVRSNFKSCELLLRQWRSLRAESRD